MRNSIRIVLHKRHKEHKWWGQRWIDLFVWGATISITESSVLTSHWFTLFRACKLVNRHHISMSIHCVNWKANWCWVSSVSSVVFRIYWITDYAKYIWCPSPSLYIGFVLLCNWLWYTSGRLCTLLYIVLYIPPHCEKQQAAICH